MKKNFKLVLVAIIALSLNVFTANAKSWNIIYGEGDKNNAISTGDVICASNFECFTVLKTNSNTTTLIVDTYLDIYSNKQGSYSNMFGNKVYFIKQVEAENAEYKTTLINKGLDVLSVDALQVDEYKTSDGKIAKEYADALYTNYDYYVKYDLIISGHKITNYGQLKQNNFRFLENFAYIKPVITLSTKDVEAIRKSSTADGLTVTVKYVDENGNEISNSTITKNYKYKDDYSTSAKEIEGYTLDETKLPTNASGMVKDDTVVTYTYTTNKYTVTTNCVDNSGKTIETSEEEYSYNSSYSLTTPSFDGYKLISTEGSTSGTVKGDLTVTYTFAPVANLFIRLDNSVQTENGTTSYSDSEYVYAGTVAVNGTKVYDSSVTSESSYDVLSELNDKVEANTISKEIDDEEVISYLNDTYGIVLSDNQEIIWYVTKSQVDSSKTRAYTVGGEKYSVKTPACKFHIDGVIYTKETEEETPVDPEEPTEPEEPVTPVEPEEPVTPEDPEEPVTPVEPETPSDDDENIYGEGDGEETEETKSETVTTSVEETTTTTTTEAVVETTSYDVVQTGAEPKISVMSSLINALSLVILGLFAKKVNK